SAAPCGSRPSSCSYPSVGMFEDDSRPAASANAEVARLFAEIGDILEIKGEPPYRFNAYRTAARSVANATERLDRLLEQGRLREVPGFGPKAVSTLLASLERLKQRSTRQLLSDAWVAFAQVQEAIGETDDADRLAIVGSVRRMQDTVGGLDLLAGRDTPEEAEQVLQALLRLPNRVQVLDRSADEAAVQLYGGLEVRLMVVPRDAWGSALVWYTGSRQHVARLEALARSRGWRLTPLGLED